MLTDYIYLRCRVSTPDRLPPFAHDVNCPFCNITM